MTISGKMELELIDMKKKKTIETTGIVNNGKVIYLDILLPFSNNEKVKVTITDLDKEEEWLGSATDNPAFKDIFNKDEDIYTLEDGKPFNG